MLSFLGIAILMIGIFTGLAAVPIGVVSACTGAATSTTGCVTINSSVTGSVVVMDSTGSYLLAGPYNYPVSFTILGTGQNFNLSLSSGGFLSVPAGSYLLEFTGGIPNVALNVVSGNTYTVQAVPSTTTTSSTISTTTSSGLAGDCTLNGQHLNGETLNITNAVPPVKVNVQCAITSGSANTATVTFKGAQGASSIPLGGAVNSFTGSFALSYSGLYQVNITASDAAQTVTLDSSFIQYDISAACSTTVCRVLTGQLNVSAFDFLGIGAIILGVLVPTGMGKKKNIWI